MRFGHFELVEQIGEGKLTETFVVHSQDGQNLEEGSLVKRIHPGLSGDSQACSLFQDEIKIARSLTHDNILRIVDSGEHQGWPFILTEPFNGIQCSTVIQVCHENDLDVSTPIALYILLKILDSLDYIHRVINETGDDLSLFHGEISPEAVLIFNSGDVKLDAFGVADQNHHTLRSQIARPTEKTAYLAPEQVLGMPLDRRADIFNAAVILAELLIGGPLFVGKSQLSTLLAIRNVQIRTLIKNQDKLPEELELLIKKALSREPEERFSTAAEMKLAIEPFLRGFSHQDLQQSIRELVAMAASRKPPSKPENNEQKVPTSRLFYGGIDHDAIKRSAAHRRTAESGAQAEPGGQQDEPSTEDPEEIEIELRPEEISVHTRDIPTQDIPTQDIQAPEPEIEIDIEQDAIEMVHDQSQQKSEKGDLQIDFGSLGDEKMSTKDWDNMPTPVPSQAHDNLLAVESSPYLKPTVTPGPVDKEDVGVFDRPTPQPHTFDDLALNDSRDDESQVDDPHERPTSAAPSSGIQFRKQTEETTDPFDFSDLNETAGDLVLFDEEDEAAQEGSVPLDFPESGKGEAQSSQSGIYSSETPKRQVPEGATEEDLPDLGSVVRKISLPGENRHKPEEKEVETDVDETFWNDEDEDLPSISGVPSNVTFRLEDGSIIGPVEFAQAVDMIYSGEVTENDKVSIDGGPFELVKNTIELNEDLSPKDGTDRQTPRPSSDEDKMSQDALLSLSQGFEDLAGNGKTGATDSEPSKLGWLDVEPISRIFFELSKAGETGSLTVEHGPIRKSVFFKKGDPFYANSNISNESLSEHMVRKNAISRMELEMALAMEAKFDGGLIGALVGLGMIEEENLTELIRDHVREMILELFIWSKGEYRFFRNQGPEEDIDPVDLTVQSLLWEGIKSKFSLEECLAWIKEHRNWVVTPQADLATNIKNLIVPYQAETMLKTIKKDEYVGALLESSSTSRSADQYEIALALRLVDELALIDIKDQ